MSETIESPEPSRAVVPQTREKAEISTLTIVTTLVMLLVFAGLVWLVFLQRQTIPPSNEQTREERIKNLAQLNADNQKILTSYRWVDKSKGVVGIPINRAMELVLQDLAASHPHAAGPINPPAASPTPVANQPAVSPTPVANQPQGGTNQTSATPAPSASATPAASPAASPSSSPEPTASPSPVSTPNSSPQSAASPEQTTNGAVTSHFSPLTSHLSPSGYVCS